MVRIDKIAVRWNVDDELEGTVSCQARAEVSYDIGHGQRRLETLQSAGLFGIEDPDDDYRRDIGDEQLAELRDHLTHFGIDLSNFDALAARPIPFGWDSVATPSTIYCVCGQANPDVKNCRSCRRPIRPGDQGHAEGVCGICAK